jgi:hypothetical protein
MFVGDTVAIVVSLEVSVMNTPPLGAGFVKVTGKGADWPGATITLAGRMIGGDRTVMLAVVFVIFVAPAVIVAEPAARPVTGTFTLIAP